MTARVPQSETHEEFLLRASRVFPADQAQAWSRLERGVFNCLMDRLIRERGYNAISDEMLRSLSERMKRLVRQCSACANESHVRHQYWTAAADTGDCQSAVSQVGRI